MIWAVASLAAAGILGAAAVIRHKQLHRWLWSYVQGCWRGRPAADGVIDVMVCVADHFEPAWNGADLALQQQRVARWTQSYRLMANQHRDADGRRPQWTFFFPEEEYVPEHLDRLADLCRAGYGDVEVHLHHHNDTAESLRRKLTTFVQTLATRHRLLHRHPATGALQYAFVHGNWALDNSGERGAWCGVNNELIVLRETGCYADLTFPSAPSGTQPRQINSIYYAKDDPSGCKSHNQGRHAAVGAAPWGDLLLIQGPLTLDWESRSRGILPRIENGELSGDNPPSPHRADTWVRQHVHVHGQPNWVFVKLHTHGANEKNTSVLHGAAMHDTLAHLERVYNDGVRYRLHYVTAWEMYNIVRAAEAGATGNPNVYRRFTDAARPMTAMASGS